MNDEEYTSSYMTKQTDMFVYMYVYQFLTKLFLQHAKHFSCSPIYWRGRPIHTPEQVIVNSCIVEAPDTYIYIYDYNGNGDDRCKLSLTCCTAVCIYQPS